MAIGAIRLEWEGRRPAQTTVAPLPNLYVGEIYGSEAADGWRNRLIRGDNLAIMAALQEEWAGKIDLIYIDPPFFTGAEQRAQTVGVQGETLPAYSDDWNGELGVYLQWLLDRLTLARELLAPTGSLYVHLSWHAAHYAKLLLDEIFGIERFQNEIVWCYREAINSKKRWNRKHDTILFYSKGERFTFNPDPVREPYKESHIKKYRQRDERGAYRLMGRGINGSPVRSHRDLPPEAEAQYPGLTFRHYLGQGTLPVDYWLIDIENQASRTRTGYPTQKPEELLERILLASTNPGDVVADLCCGSGTTLAVAQRLGRRWIGCDLGALALHTCRKRLLTSGDDCRFTVEAACGEPRPSVVAWETMARLEQEGDEMRLRLSDDAAAGTDMWAVQWIAESVSGRTADDADALPFALHWWSARTRARPQLETVSAPVAVGSACAWRIVAINAAGTPVTAISPDLRYM